MSAQFDLALSEAAEAIDSLGPGWDDIGPDEEAEQDLGPDLLPLEFQLADLERAVDSILEERDRILYGYPAGADAASAGAAPSAAANPGRQP